MMPKRQTTRTVLLPQVLLPQAGLAEVLDAALPKSISKKLNRRLQRAKRVKSRLHLLPLLFLRNRKQILVVHFQMSMPSKQSWHKSACLLLCRG
jgi:hypothetical protein